MTLLKKRKLVQKKDSKVSARDLAKKLMKVLQQPSNRVFLGGVQTIFLANAIEKGQVIVRYSTAGDVMGFLVWNIRKIKAKDPFILGKGDFNVKYIASSEDYKRKGTGSFLIKKAEALAKKKKCLRVVTQVREENAPMIGMMTALGHENFHTVPMGMKHGGTVAMVEFLKEIIPTKTIFD